MILGTLPLLLLFGSMWKETTWYEDIMTTKSKCIGMKGQ